MIDVTLRVERLWWTINQENKRPSEWKDRPVILSRDDLSTVSRNALWIRFPGNCWCDGINAGFDRSRTYYFPIKVTEDTLAIPLRAFSDSDARNQCGTTALTVRTGHPHQLSGFLVGQLTIGWLCRVCNKPVEETDLCDHALKHSERFFRSLSYDEIREYLPKIPSKIFLCHYCRSYIGESDLHPTSAIIRHQQADCKKIVRTGDDLRISFRVIDDVDEIRENYDKNLPHIFKCKECDENFRDPTNTRLVNHMMEKHKNLLYRLK